jgi:hypothetical protein
MRLKDEELREFVAIWKRVFNDKISLADARHRASQLVTLYLALAKRLPEETDSPEADPPISS